MGKSTTSMTCWSLPSPAKACDSDRPANTPIQNYIIPSCENGRSPVRSATPPNKKKAKTIALCREFPANTVQRSRSSGRLPPKAMTRGPWADVPPMAMTLYFCKAFQL
jgi:hypothetical protein